MTDHLKNIRDGLERLARLGNGDYYGNSDGNLLAQQLLPELDALEQAMNTPVAWCKLTASGNIAYFDGKPMFMDGSVGNEHHKTPLFAAPPAQQPQAEAVPAGCVVVSAAVLRKLGIAGAVIETIARPVPAQQPQARPDFNDEWTGYLKDGETPFERFMRERKDLTSLTKLYQRTLEENEQLKAQQAQPTDLQSIEQYRMQMAGISTAALGYWKEGDSTHPDYDTVALRDVAKLYAKYEELYRKQAQAEAVQLVDPHLKAAANYAWQQANEAEQAEAAPQWKCCPPGKCAYRHLNRTANCPRENLPAAPQPKEQSK